MFIIEYANLAINELVAGIYIKGKTMQKYLQRALLMSVLIAFVISIAWYAGTYFSLEYLQTRAFYLRSFVITNYTQALCIYGFLYGCIVIVGIPVVAPLTLLGGYLFGAVPVFFCALTAIAVGMTISFFCIRTFFIGVLKHKFAHQLAQFATHTEKYGITHLLTLNLLTIVPLVLITTLAALSNISLWSLLWTSLVGSMPMLMIYAFAGKKFAEITAISDIFSPPLIGLLVVLVALSVVPLIMKRLQAAKELDIQK